MTEIYKFKDFKKISPSGKYIVTNYPGTLVRISDNKIIYELPNNVLTLDNHTIFFNRNNQEWFYSCRSYESQIFINLDTEEIFDNTEDIKKTYQYKAGLSFYWGSLYLSLDGNTLAVYGCYWAYPYQFMFYDFSNPSQGWKQLKCDTDLTTIDGLDPYWTKSGLFICYDGREYIEIDNKYMDTDYLGIDELPDDDSKYEFLPQKMYTLKRKGDTMVLLAELKTEKRRQDDIDREENWKREDETDKNIMNESELYNTLNEKLKQSGFNSALFWELGSLNNGRKKSFDVYVKGDNNVCSIKWRVDNEGKIILTCLTCPNRNMEFERNLDSVMPIIDQIKEFLKN